MATRDHQAWNYKVLFVQGISWDGARALASPRLVLPYLYVALGAPVLFAGLLLPLVQVSRLIALVAAAPAISAARLRKWYGAIGVIAVAASLAVIGLAAGNAEASWLAVVFLLFAAVIGLARGITSIAYQDLLGRVLPTHRQSHLLFTESALAGLLAIAIAWSSKEALGDADPLDSHLVLLWAAAGVCLLSGLFIMIIREQPGHSPSAQAPTSSSAEEGRTGYFADLRRGFGTVAAVPWFRRFLVARGLFLSVELAMPFYAIHAASLHSNKFGSLSLFVIASSAGVIVGGPLWRRVSKTSTRAVMASGSAIAAAGGLLALTIELWPQIQQPVLHAGVFFLLSIAAQGVINARTVYLVGLAPEAERPYYIAVGETVSGGLGVLVAFAFGALAHFQHVAWPVLCILALNLLALLYTTRLQPLTFEAKPEGKS